MWTKISCGAVPSLLLLFAWPTLEAAPGTTTGPASESASSASVDADPTDDRYRVFKWVVGDDRVKLIPVREGFCFLSAVGGSFAGGGENVRVYVDDGWWYLEGKCLQPFLWAEATCVEFGRLAADLPPRAFHLQLDVGGERRKLGPIELTAGALGGEVTVRVVE